MQKKDIERQQNGDYSNSVFFKQQNKLQQKKIFKNHK